MKRLSSLLKLLRKILRLILTVSHWVFFPLLCIACLICRLLPRNIDIGIGPQPLINNVYWARALRRKNYSVETFVNKPYYITNEFDRIFSKGWRKIFYYVPALSFLRCIALYKCVYVYFNGGPLYCIPGIRLLEPYLFYLSGVKTVVMPYGSDSQILDLTPNKIMVNALCKDYPKFFQNNHSVIKRQVNAWCKSSDIVIGAMDSIDYLYFWNRIHHCHYAIDTDSLTPVYPAPQNDVPIKILHAPNHKAIKGSEAVFRAVDQLKSEGYDIELIFLQGVPNSEFLKFVSQADIVIDQLIMGWYAMFALEAMSLGKPVVCYLRTDLVKTFEDIGCVEHEEIPLISATALNIVDVLREMLNHPEALTEHGLRGRAFVEKYHSLDAIGDFFDEINKSLSIFPQSDQEQ
jgi:glycosyltransferase involved in cell wall biosynthesis